MADWLDELERLEPMATPGPFHWDDAFAAVRTDRRMRAIGNAVVPAVAQWIGERILEAID